MEEEVKSLKSPVLSKPDIKRELEYLKHAVDESQKRVDYTTAHDTEILKAIQVVERYLRKHKRICYGGTAINAILPSNMKFYNPKYDIPDYDMFTPDVKGDVDGLLKELEKEGFVDVNQKVGIHEGTRKVLVNFIPVADFTEMNETLFRIVSRRAYVVDGIYYCDPEFLRMMMYLELSRPRGQVDRWEKVYERLVLLEKAHPMRLCRQSIVVPHIEPKLRETLLDFIVKRKRVLAGVETIDFYEEPRPTLKLENLVQEEGVVVFFSADAKHDAEDIESILGKAVKWQYKKRLSDDLYDYCLVRYQRKPVAFIIQENACHSYIPINLSDGRSLRLASLDLLMNLYLSLVVFGKKEEHFLQVPVLCLAELTHGFLLKYRKNPTKLVPPFTVTCSGRQKAFASLQKERAQRVEMLKKVKRNSTMKKNITGGAAARKAWGTRRRARGGAA